MLDRLLYYVKVIVFITGSLAFVGCVTYTDTLEVRSQIVDITSNPTGAHITMSDENGTRSLGETPTQLNADYTVTQRTYDKASCAFAGAGAVSSAMSDDDDDYDDDDEMSDVEAILGIVGLFAGAAAGAAACAEADGVVAINPHTFGLEARLEGYHTQRVVILVPKEKPRVHFEMVPLNRRTSPTRSSKSTDTKPKKVSTAGEGEVPRVVVWDIETSVDGIDSELVDSLSVSLTEEFADSDRFVTVDRETVQRLLRNREVLTRGGSAASRHETIARSLRAPFNIETRIVKKKDQCFVAMSLINTKGGDLKLLAATQSACDQDGLEEAMEVVSGILTSPPDPAAGSLPAEASTTRP